MLNDIKEFDEYIIKNFDKLVATDGEDCKNCPRRKECLKQGKIRDIDDIVNMSMEKTRFPILLRLLQNHKRFFELLPVCVYYWMYGDNRWINFGCVFKSKELCNNLDKVHKVYDMLDEQSKLVYINTLMTRLSCNWEYSKSVMIKDDEYFIDEFSNLNNNEVFVDCGAYTGDTLEKYLEYNEVPKSYYLFEPDSENFNKLKSNEKVNDILSNCHLIPKGLADKQQKLWINSGLLYASYVSENAENGNDTIDITTLDDEIKEPITFIKMDIEGFEQKAINGAENHIKNETPKLAICLYHNITDFWEIPLMIKKINPKYNVFKIKHYSPFWQDTILYAYCDQNINN